MNCHDIKVHLQIELRFLLQRLLWLCSVYGHHNAEVTERGRSKKRSGKRDSESRWWWEDQVKHSRINVNGQLC